MATEHHIPLTDAKCPKCGAPCKAKVNERGGDWGWGTSDRERTTYAYAAPPDTITIQEAWEAAGGNPGIKATKDELLEALRGLDEVCDEADARPKAGQLQEAQDAARWRTLEELVVPQHNDYWYVHPGEGTDRMKSAEQLRRAIDAFVPAAPAAS